MNTATKVDNGNDSDKGMSPALTQELGQDVDNTPNSDGYNGLAKRKPVTIKSDWPKLSDSGRDSLIENGDSIKLLSDNEILTSHSDRTSANGNSILHSYSDYTTNVVQKPTQLEDSVGHPTMTHGDVNDITNNNCDEALATQITLTNGLLHDTCRVQTSSKQQETEPETILEPPAIATIHEKHKKLVSDAQLLVSRIQHLQSMVVTRHTRHQLMLLVEHHHKCLSEQSKVRQDILQHVNGVGSSVTSGSSDLSTMSTSALVDLVQRMQTKIPVLQRLQPSLPGQTIFMNTADRARVQEAAGVMTSTLTHLHSDIDSDATASSSGGETDDEDTKIVDLAAKVERKSTLRTKACWRWSRDRAQVISRWTWLQAQVSDLEYKIRQHGDLHRQLRAVKNPIIQPPNSLAEDNSMRAARCIPYINTQDRRHKIVRIANTPSLGPKGSKVIMMPCQCAQSGRQCAICAGHHNYFKPMDIHTYCRKERAAQVDKSFHPVLSFTRDIDPTVELEEVMNSSQHKHSSVNARKLLKASKRNHASELLSKKALVKLSDIPKEMRKNKLTKKRLLDDPLVTPTDQKLRPKKRKYNKRIKNSALRARSSSFSRWCDESNGVTDETNLSASAPVGELKQSSNQKKHTFGIDDIVIPYHIAASTRVEKLQYKEIDTPRWRELNADGSSVHDIIRSSTSVPSTPMTPVTPSSSYNASDSIVNNMSTTATCSVVEPVSLASAKSSFNSLQDLEVDEDITDAKYTERHLKMEETEKMRYMNFVTLGRRHRAQSAVVPATQPRTITHPESISTVDTATMEMTNAHRPLTHANSIPLSSSQEVTHVKDDLQQTQRKRSNSFAANRVKKDIIIDVAECPPVFPWSRRTFPLTADDELSLDPNWKPPKGEQVVEQQVSESEQWKVVSPEESGNQGPSLVLKLSKA